MEGSEGFCTTVCLEGPIGSNLSSCIGLLNGAVTVTTELDDDSEIT